MLTLISPLLVVVAGLVAPVLRRFCGRATGWLLALLPAGLAIHFARLFADGTIQDAPRLAVAWAPSLGVEFAVRPDGLAAGFAALVAAIGALIIVYAEGYMAGSPRLGRLQALLFVFMGSMLGVVLADDMITLFVFWELTSVSSFLLIGFDYERGPARRAALTALLVTGGGGLALLAGIVLMHLAAVDLGVSGADAWSIAAMNRLELAQHPFYGAILTLVLAGALTKSAQVPFHGWLPRAMAAPTPVSAYLHSATMVKAGVFLLARIHPALGGTVAWTASLTAFGAVTMLVGAVLALRQHDLKRVLAFSTVSVLGTLTMLLGAGTTLALKAAVVFLVAHALYKAALFMVAGIIDLETGTRDLRRLGGLAGAMPLAAAAGVLAALSKAGAPPMFGFVGKELLYKAKLDLESGAAWLVVAAVIANIALVASAFLVAARPFFGRRRETPKEPHEAPWTMLLGPLLLAGAGLFVGLMPAIFDRTVGPAMAGAIAGRPVSMDLQLWYGFSPSAMTVVGLSAVTLLAGFAVARAASHRLSRTTSAAGPPETRRHDPLDAVAEIAGVLTRRVQTGSLRGYIAVTLLVPVVLALPWALRAAARGVPAGDAVPGLHEWVLAAMVVAGGWAAALLRSRLAAIAALGVTGCGLAGLFALYGAPDLALTQIMVEVLLVVLFVLLFRRLPASRFKLGPVAKPASLLLALASGLLVGLLTFAAASVAATPDMSRFFLESSVPEANGRNVVNVILVDFRALDTLGEILVVACAGAGVLALVGGLRARRSG